ncbi:MAG: VanZ family protein [Clostridiales bacterium]|nr:VanZ family protein [Clostridiales bacterium]
MLFVMYIAEILTLTFYNPRLRNRAGVNIIPFRTIMIYMRAGGEAALINLVGNVVVFIPFGSLAPALFAKTRKFPEILAVAVAMPLMIEILQFSFGRSTDIDDVILNAAGILTGYAVYSAYKKW